MKNNKANVHWGDIFYCDLGANKGSVQSGMRPVIIVQTERLNKKSPTAVVWDHKPLTDFWRIGAGTAARLERFGMYTMRDIANAPEDLLYRTFGIDVFPKYTIVLDRYLLHEAESGRRRFTLAHEAGHYLLCRHNPEQTVPSYRRTFDAEREYTKQEIEEMFSLNEFWADKMAACLLMPDFIVKKAVSKYYKNKKVAVYGNSIFAPKDKIRLRKMADEIGVSFSALIIRLKHLNYVEYHETSEYIDKYLQVGESI